MKKKLIIIISVVVMFLICAYGLFDYVFPEAAAITTPDTDSVLTITIVRNDGVSAEVTTADHQQVLQVIAKAQPTRKMSVNDYPSAKVYYDIKAVGSVSEYHCFVYREGNQTYIEIPYEGIYRTENQFLDTVERYFNG